jgi:glycosyltransferase involved in cell wall biosynthesis
MKKTGYKIAYLCQFDPLDKRTNSGTQWYMIKALRENGNEVYPIFQNDAISKFCMRVLYKFYRLRYKNASMFYHSTLLSIFYGIYFTLRLKFKKFDLIFISRGSPIIPFLKVNIPIVYTSDATFHLMLNYYDGYANITKDQCNQGEYIEQTAISRSQLRIYPSVWAAKSAIHHYGANSQKVFVIPSGANFDKELPSPNALAKRLSSASCKILFVGRDWNVKGGEVALEAVNILNKGGIPTTLTVIGCKPAIDTYPAWLKIIPFLDKNNIEDAKQLADYFSKSHFFVLPTRNEAFGLVFAEACAYGLPIMATQTGGVPTCVENGVNGYLFDITETGENYAAKISTLWNDSELYTEFSTNSRKKYDDLLNWKVWGQAVQIQINRIMV